MNNCLQFNDVLAPGRDIDGYMRTIGGFSILPAEKEKQLAENLFYKGDIEAAKQLVLGHLRFVVHIAKSYCGYGLPLADLIQEGNVGLMKAVKRFNPEVGVRLVSFAVHWIKAEIHEFILRNWRIVKVATTKAQRKLFFNLRSIKKGLSWLSEAEANAIAHDLGVAVGTVREMEGRMFGQDTSFHGLEDEDENNYTAPCHFLKNDSGDPASVMEANDWLRSSEEKLHNAMRLLDDRSKHIIDKRWLQERKMTLHELANQYQVSAERIRQLEKNALEKLRRAILSP